MLAMQHSFSLLENKFYNNGFKDRYSFLVIVENENDYNYRFSLLIIIAHK